MLTIFAVDPFVVDLEAMGAAVAGGLTLGRILVVAVLALTGLGLLFKDQLVVAWSEAKKTAKIAAPPDEAILHVTGIAIPDDDLSHGIAFARSLDEIFERQGVSFETRRQRFLDAVESVSPFGVVSPPMPAEPAKGGAA